MRCRRRGVGFSNVTAAIKAMVAVEPDSKGVHGVGDKLEALDWVHEDGAVLLPDYLEVSGVGGDIYVEDKHS